LAHNTVGLNKPRVSILTTSPSARARRSSPEMESMAAKIVAMSSRVSAFRTAWVIDQADAGRSRVAEGHRRPISLHFKAAKII
jgi:hypothetical protein